MKRRPFFKPHQAVELDGEGGRWLCVHRRHTPDRETACELMQAFLDADNDGRAVDADALEPQVARYLIASIWGADPGYYWGLDYKQGTPGAIPLWVLDLEKRGAFVGDRK